MQPKDVTTRTDLRTIFSIGIVQRATAIAPLLVGVFTLIGWTFDVTLFIRVSDRYPVMAPATACGLIVAGIALYLTCRSENSRKLVGKIFGVALATFMSLFLIQDIFELNLSIDDILFADKVTHFGPENHPGRPSPHTALSLIGIGLSIAFIDTRFRRRYVGEFLGYASAIIALTALLGHLYGVDYLLGKTRVSGMAINAAIAIGILTTGVLLARPSRGLIQLLQATTPTGNLFRKLFVAVLFIPPLVGRLSQEGSERGIYSNDFRLALTTLATIVLLTALVSITVRKLSDADQARQNVLHELNTSQQMYRLLSHHLPNTAIFLFNRNLVHIIADGQGLIPMNQTPATSEGVTVDEYFPDNVRSKIHDLYISTLDGNECTADSNFHERTWHISTIPVSNDSQIVEFGMAVFQDVTLERQAEAELRDSENTFRSLLDAAPDAIVIVDLDGNIVLANRQAERLFGYTQRQLINSPVSMLIPESKRGQHQQHIESFFNAPSTRPMGAGLQLYAVRQDGSEFPAEISLSPIDTPKGKRVAAAVRDSTERMELERSLRRFNEELEHRVGERTADLQRANAELESFSYSVSHDLRAPLRAMHGFASILIEDYEAALPTDARQYLDLILQNAKQMGQLIDDLLQFSRLQRQALRLINLDMKDLVLQAWAELDHERVGRDIQLKIGDLGTCTGDQRLLKHVFLNLLGNSIKYTHRDNAVIEVGAFVENGHRVWFVKDNGTGFDMQFSDKLFEVFQRLHDPTEYEGTGIGLALVKRVITRHGGKIWAHGEPGKGATFFFTLDGETYDG